MEASQIYIRSVISDGLANTTTKGGAWTHICEKDLLIAKLLAYKVAEEALHTGDLYTSPRIFFWCQSSGFATVAWSIFYIVL